MTQRLTQLDNVPAVMNPAEFTVRPRQIGDEREDRARAEYQGGLTAGSRQLRKTPLYNWEMSAPPTEGTTVEPRRSTYRNHGNPSAASRHLPTLQWRLSVTGVPMSKADDDLRSQLIRSFATPTRAGAPSNAGTHYERGRAPGAQHGGEKLGMSVDIVPPENAFLPYHFHYAEEGPSSCSRFGHPSRCREMLPIAAGDVIFIPPGPGTTHQILNTSDAPLKYLSLPASTPSSRSAISGFRQITSRWPVAPVVATTRCWDGPHASHGDRPRLLGRPEPWWFLKPRNQSPIVAPTIPPAVASARHRR